MKQTNSLSSKDENMSSENGAAGLTQTNCCLQKTSTPVCQ